MSLASCATSGTLPSCLLPNGKIAYDVSEQKCIEMGGDPMSAGDLEVRAFAEPPVHRIPLSELTPIACGDTTELTLAVYPGQWLEWPVAWIAVDSATARANWDSMTYRFTINDSLVIMPTQMRWVTETASVDCGERTLDGVLVGPLVYLAPLSQERVLGLTFSFNADVNDGWTTFARGSTASYTVRLRPLPE